MVTIEERDAVAVLRSYYKGEPFSMSSFQYEPFKEMMGFHGCHGFLKIRTKESGEMTFFVKGTTEIKEVFEKYYKGLRCFFKESRMMTKVLTELQAFVGHKLMADCYLTKEDEYLVTEDLTAIGYEVQRVVPTDVDHAEVALKALAALHAASLIQEELSGVPVLERYKDIHFETFFNEYPPDYKCLVYSIQTAVKDMLDKHFTHIPREERDSVMKMVWEGSTMYCRLVTDERRVVTHGDPWGNNILYKYDEEGKPIQACLVDFQGSRLAPPAMEVNEYLYLEGDLISKEGPRARLIDSYYESLGEILLKSGLQVQNLLPREEFDSSCSKYRIFGLCTRMNYSYMAKIPSVYLTPVYSDPTAYLGLMMYGDSTCGMRAFENDRAYKDRFTNAFVELYDFWKSNYNRGVNDSVTSSTNERNSFDLKQSICENPVPIEPLIRN